MARLFKRAASVTLAKPTGYSSQSPSVTTIRDLRFTFEIEKHLKREPNTCEIVIYNLAEQSRFLFQEKPLHVRLDAGYGDLLERVFSGDLQWGSSKHEATEWETRLQLGDGDRAFRFARVSRSFGAGVTVKTALTEAAKSMGLTLPRTVTDAQLSGQYVSGLVMHGTAANELSRLLAPLEMDWSIQDGRLQILNRNAARPGDVTLISQDTGLIGSPEYAAPEFAHTSDSGRKTKGKPPVLTFRVLLKPGLIPGGKVEVKSVSASGNFRVEKVRHIGDTHGDDWYSEVECVQVRA